jgi:predicted Zn finger-like uncharacterized protein
MNLTITCPSCQRSLRVPENLLGQAVKCPSCAHTFVAPENAEEPQRPPEVAPPPRDSGAKPFPSQRRSPDDDYDEEDHPETPYRRRRVRPKPGKVQAIAIMMLVGGILATLGSGAVLLYFGLIGVATMGFGLLCCLWPGPYFGLVMGIMAITKGAQLLGDKDYRVAPPQGIAIMMIINIINADLVNLVLGIIVLVFLADEEVKEYFRG